MERNQISQFEEGTPLPSLADPHHKTSLTSPLGRFVERASYTDLAGACVVVLSMATAYFCWGPTGHTVNAAEHGMVDAAYFSLVTFTSLGYGDLSPIGFGRLVAVLVVLFGLFFIALLVGKFASERQQAVLVLLHTSDCQRRLNHFTSEIDHSITDFKAARLKSTIADVHSAAKRLAALVEATSNYLVFNANQARLMAFGNESALLALYKSLATVQRIFIEVHRSEKADLLLSRRTRALALRCEGVVLLMRRFHENSEQQTSYIRAFLRMLSALFKGPKQTPSALSQRVSSISSAMSENGDNFRAWLRSGYTPAVIETVWSAAPSGEPATWGADLRKRMAIQLDISSSLAQKCLTSLRTEGRLPKPAPKKSGRRQSSLQPAHKSATESLDGKANEFEVTMRD